MTYFPYEEDQAGILRDNHETGKKSEALLADEQILSLAKELLSENTYMEAESLARMLTQSRSNKAAARSKLI